MDTKRRKIPPRPPNANAIMKDYSFHLAKAHEMKALLNSNRCKMECPRCGSKTYKVYVDNAGQMIDVSCGKCDRINNCDYHVPPKEFFAQHPDQSGKADAAAKLPPPVAKEAYRIPPPYVTASWQGQPDSVLTTWLKSLPWNIKQRQSLDIALTAYRVGNDNGATVWWQIDNQYGIRTGKIMRYKTDGHRDKSNFGTWVHSRLESQGILDPRKGGLVQCLFGLHLLRMYNLKRVNIVESEKSAVIATAYFSHHGPEAWMATGGLFNLSRASLQPLIDADVEINLYPDHDAFDKWVERAKEIKYDRLNVRRFVERNYIEGRDPDNADIADIILRKLLEDPQAQHY